jgi:hypothetical protein
MDLREVGLEGVDWNHLIEWQGLVNTGGKFLQRALISAASFNICPLHILSSPSDQFVACLLLSY